MAEHQGQDHRWQEWQNSYHQLYILNTCKQYHHAQHVSVSNTYIFEDDAEQKGFAPLSRLK